MEIPDPAHGQKFIGDIGYFGIMPLDTGNCTYPDDPVVSSCSDMGNTFWWDPSRPVNISNLGPIWIAVASDNSTMRSISCELYDTFVEFDVVFTNHVGTIQNVTKTWLNEIGRESADPHGQELDPPEYANIIFGLSNYFVGPINRIASVNLGDESETDLQNPAWIELPRLLQTSLVLTTELYSMMEKIKNNTYLAAMFENTDGVANLSLGDVIEEFSLNSMLSTLSDPIFWYVYHNMNHAFRIQLMDIRKQQQRNGRCHWKNNPHGIPL